jgi:hypothetical protein
MYRTRRHPDSCFPLSLPEISATFTPRRVPYKRETWSSPIPDFRGAAPHSPATQDGTFVHFSRTASPTIGCQAMAATDRSTPTGEWFLSLPLFYERETPLHLVRWRTGCGRPFRYRPISFVPSAYPEGRYNTPALPVSICPTVIKDKTNPANDRMHPVYAPSQRQVWRLPAGPFESKASCQGPRFLQGTSETQTTLRGTLGGHNPSSRIHAAANQKAQEGGRQVPQQVFAKTQAWRHLPPPDSRSFYGPR